MTSATSESDLDSDILSDQAFRQQYPVVWWLTLLGPFVVGFTVVALTWMLANPTTAAALVATALASFFALGRFIILGGAVADQAGFFTTEQLFFLSLFVDLFPATLMCFHMDIIFRVPHVGPRLKRVTVESRHLMVSNPWLRRTAFLTVVVFVLLPVTATGTVFGSILARVLGLARGVAYLAVGLGSLIAAGIIYLLAEFARAYADLSNPWIVGAMLACLALLVGILTVLFQRVRNRMESPPPPSPPSDPAPPSEHPSV